MRTYAYRLYPSKTQTRLLESTVETCRHFYNDLLSEPRSAVIEPNVIVPEQGIALDITAQTA